MPLTAGRHWRGRGRIERRGGRRVLVTRELASMRGGAHSGGGERPVQPLAVVGQTHKLPFGLGFFVSPQQKPCESEHVLDDAEHRFHRLLAQSIPRPAGLGVELRLHGLGPGAARRCRSRADGRSRCQRAPSRGGPSSAGMASISATSSLASLAHRLTRAPSTS